ncbi:MAG: NAD(P)-dependent oxidoreductase [Opitutales bacterium]
MKPEVITFIGLGEMGLAMAVNLVRAGYLVTGVDRSETRVQSFAEAGGRVDGDWESDLKQSDFVMTSVSNGEAFLALARETLLPHARTGQIYVDLGTLSPPDVRELAEAFARKSATLLDVPVSGGPGGAREGSLRMFAGGERAAFTKVRPLLEVLGEPEAIDYCGSSGSGQLMKAVNQLGMGLIQAAALECVAFGINAGLDPEAINRLVGGDNGWRALIRQVSAKAQDETAQWVGVKHGQLPYFFREAQARGFPMPLSQALHAFLDGHPEVIREANRRSPSFWRALTENTK